MIIVTGAGGFIGSAMMRHFHDIGVESVGLTTDSSALTNCRRGVDIRRKVYQLVELTTLFKQLKPTAIIHAAGPASVGNAIQNPNADFRGSVLLSQRLLEAVRRSETAPRVVLLSSAAVYGNPSVLPIAEDSQLNPISSYGFHKLLCENLGQEYSDCYRIPVSIVRIFSVFGPLQKRLLIWDLVRKFLKEPVVSLSGTGSETRDFVFVDDLVSQITQVAINTTGPFAIFNVGSGISRSIRDVAERVQRLLGSSKPIGFNGVVRPGDPVTWQADISKLEAAIGPQGEQNFDLRLSETLREWCK